VTPQQVINEYGYLAVFFGTFLEGETILAIAGFLASRSMLNLPTVVVVAFLGAWIGHMFWFWIGRVYGVRLLNRFPSLHKPLDKVIDLFDRYGISAVFLTQYIYGIRLTAAIMFGLSHLTYTRFALYQGLSCALWALLITGLGYYFGEAIERILGNVAHIEQIGIGVLVAIGIAFYVYHKLASRRRSREANEALQRKE
jgi:membrane protein DedA with SNARE-associated domain